MQPGAILRLTIIITVSWLVCLSANRALAQVSTVSADNAFATEGDGEVRFVVRLNPPSSQIVSLRYRTDSGSATTSDYGYKSYSPLAFAPGETTKSVNIAITNDIAAEGEESFYLLLSDPSNGSIGTGSAVGVIYDNDAFPAPGGEIKISDRITDESAGTATLVVTLEQPVTSPVSARYATKTGTAGQTDFRAKSGTLTFTPRQRVKTVSIPIVNDTIRENDEIFSVVLSNPVNATLADNTGRIRIAKNDQPRAFATINANNPKFDEGNGLINFVISLSSPSSQVVSLRYRTDSGSATISDYGYLSYTPLSFAPGETSKLVGVSLRDDTLIEGDEAFYLDLSDEINGIVGVGGTGTILDNDGAGGLAGATAALDQQ